MRQNPQRPVHALLEGSMNARPAGWKKTPSPTWLSFTHNLIFSNHQKTRLTKTPNNQKPLLTKIFAKEQNMTKEITLTLKTWHNQNWTPPTKPTQFAKCNSPETLLEKDEPILRTYTTNHEQSRRNETKPNWHNQKVRWLTTSQRLPPRLADIKNNTASNEKNLPKRQLKTKPDTIVKIQKTCEKPSLKNNFSQLINFQRRTCLCICTWFWT